MNKLKRTLLILSVAVISSVQADAQGRTSAYGYAFTESELTKYPQKTNLPTIYLEVYKTQVDATTGKALPIAEGETPELEDLSTVFGTKNDWYYNAQIIIRDDNGTIEERKEPTTVRGRGNSTWNIGNGAYKRPLRLKFPQKTALLGDEYAKEKSWTLLANHYDATLIRNAMTYEMGKLAGLAFCPAYKFVDLVVNDRYMGTYQISDQVQVADKRVPINEATGYFMEALALKEGFLEDPYLKLEMGNSWTNMYVNIKSPDPDVETSNGPTTDTKYDELKSHLNFVSNLVLNGEFNRPSNWRNYVDMESAVNAFIAMDITGNYDGVVGNDYFYMNDLNSPIFFGPLWDSDLAWGGIVNSNDMTEKHFWEGESQPFGTLCQRAYNDPYFMKKVHERWLQIYDGGSLVTTLKSRMSAIKEQIAQSAALNYKSSSEGGAGEVLNKGSWNDQSYADLAAAYTSMETFITNHISYLNSAYQSQYENLNCDNLDEIPESGLFFDGTGALWGGSENVYTYIAKGSDIRVNAKLTVTVEGSGAYFSVFVTDSNDKMISTYGGAPLTETKVLTQYDVDKLIANGNTLRIVVSNGTCASVVLERPDPCAVHTYTDSYGVQDDGTYRRVCDVCGDEDNTVYYKFTIYPESSEASEVYATSWEPDAEKPNSIAVISVTGKVPTGYNIINNGVCANFRLTDGHPFYNAKKFTATQATYSRNVTNDWGTMVLPFKYQQASNATASFYHLSAISDEGGTKKLLLTAIQPEVEGNASAYVPVFFKRANDEVSVVTVTATDVTVKKSSTSMESATVDGWTLKGVMTETQAIDVATDVAWTDKNLYYISNNQFWHAIGEVNIQPFRAYLESAETVESISLMIDDEEVTGIRNLTPALIQDNDAWYSIDGRQHEGRPSKKGIYIHKGRKEVIP